MTDINEIPTIFGSIGDREDISFQSPEEVIERLKRVLADSAEFFDNYSNLPASEQVRLQADKDQMIRKMRRYI